LKEANKHYVDTSRVTIREIGKSTAKKMIVKYHYSHAWTMCRYALGVFYETDEKDVLGNTETLIGCLVYGYPVGRSAIKSVIDGLEKDECLELTRLFIHDGYGSNIESFAMGQSFKWMKDNASNIKMLLSYADPEQMHLGGIYQATNWLYQDCRDIQLMPNYSISIESDPHKWIHSRTVFSRWGSHNLDHLKTQLGKENLTEFWRKKESAKHRYIQVLGQNKSEKRKLTKRLKHKVSPYPKDASEFLSEVVHHETFTPENQVNFW
jgi:hypothetical protein